MKQYTVEHTITIQQRHFFIACDLYYAVGSWQKDMLENQFMASLLQQGYLSPGLVTT